MSSSTGSRKCSSKTKAGQPCKAWAMHGRRVCSAHGEKTGAPAGNQNRKTHGFYTTPTTKLKTIDDVVEDLLRKQEQLSDYINQQFFEDISPEQVLHLLALSAQNASRLGRLMRDQRALSKASADGLLEAVSKLFDEINTEMNLAVKI